MPAIAAKIGMKVCVSSAHAQSPRKRVLRSAWTVIV